MSLTDQVRAHVYRHFAETGAAPRFGEVAAALAYRPDKVEDACLKLASDHLLVLTPDRRAIERAGPFSAAPTPFRVISSRRSWWANCAWDALGIPALLGVDAVIETRCGDCGESMTMSVVGGELGTGRGFVHFGLPARRWWDDIRYT